MSIHELESQHDALVAEVAALTKQNQARRIEVVLSQRGRTVALYLAIALAFCTAFVVAARWFPGTWHTSIVCR